MTYQLYIGLDVGKGEHHATALLPDGTIVHDKPLAQSEPKLRDLFTDLIA
ncbi:IS110 family transposase, partial [Falsarthrobacter nasiphocae]